MPLVYQGRLFERTPDTPSAALKAAGAILTRATHDHRLDLRLTWEAPAPFERCAAELPDHFTGFWIDMAIEPDPRRLDDVVRWAETLRGGAITAACTVAGRGNEVTLRLDGPEALRLDAERLDPHRRRLYRPRPTVRYAETGQRAGLSAERRALAAARTRAAAGALGLEMPHLRAIFVDDARIPPAAGHWLEVRPRPIGPGLGPVADDRLPLADLADLEGAVVDDTPFGLQCDVTDRDERVALWRRWSGLLDRTDQIRLRCMGPRSVLEDLLGRFDPHHRHPGQPHATFGLYTAHHPDPLPREALAAMVRAPDSDAPLMDWGLRWSSLRLKVDGPLDQAEGPADSFFVVRAERSRIHDSLHLTLETEDPASRALRSARHQLAGDFGGLVERPSAWQYIGPAVDTSRGRRYDALRADLAPLATRVPSESTPIGARTPDRPRWLGRLVERARTISRDDAHSFDLAAEFERRLLTALPGFRHDKRAHATDRYFITFARQTAHGVHLILLRRLHGPSGFRISVGVSTVPLQLDDLDPGTGRSAPGLAVPLADLVPERATLDWHYAGRLSAERAATDAVAVLAARAGPYFAAADAVLARHAAAEERSAKLPTTEDAPASALVGEALSEAGLPDETRPPKELP